MYASFNDTFNQEPSSLPQMAAWLRKLSLEQLSADDSSGFAVTIHAGEVLVVPEGYMIMEACLGDHDADVISYPFLLKGKVNNYLEQVL